MLLDRIVRLLLPRQDQFFVHLENIAAKLTEVVAVFERFVEAPPAEYAGIASKLRSLEHEADDLSHQLYEELDRTFVTPIDREDLHLLTSSLDDVTDVIEHSAAFIVLYQLPQLTGPMKQLIRLTRLCTEDVVAAVKLLRTLNRTGGLQKLVVNVNSLENQGDEIYRRALQELFVVGHEPADLVRQKDILFCLEEGLDACEDVMDVIRSVVAKNG